MSVHPTLHPVETHRRLNAGLRGGGDRVNHQHFTGRAVRRELEPFDRWPHPQRLVRPDGVVLLDPGVQRGLQLLHGGVAAIMDAEELGTNRLMPALHFPCGGWGSRRSQQMPNTVLGADPIEHHFRARAGRPEAAGEHFPIVAPMAVKGFRRL